MPVDSWRAAAGARRSLSAAPENVTRRPSRAGSEPAGRGQKEGSAFGGHIVFADESGFALTPTVARACVPSGQTPWLHQSQRHDRVSVISGISVSSERRRVGLYYQWHPHNIREREAVAFLPAYAPGLNPGEGVWRRTQHRLANGCPADRFDVAMSLVAELESWRRSRSRLWNCISHSGLAV